MFRLELPDDLLVLRMPAHRALVEEAVREKGFSGWYNGSERGKTPTRNVGMVDLLCAHPDWVRKQWQLHASAGTKLQIQQLNTKPPTMMSNAARVEFLEKANWIVRAVAEKLRVAPAPAELTLETVLPRGDYFYVILVGGLSKFKAGHFKSNSVAWAGAAKGKDFVYARYEDHRIPSGLEPGEAGLWRRDNLSLYALVEGPTLTQEREIHKELKTVAQYLRTQGYLQPPGASEFHDLRLLDAALQIMGKHGVVRLARLSAPEVEAREPEVEPAAAVAPPRCGKVADDAPPQEQVAARWAAIRQLETEIDGIAASEFKRRRTLEAEVEAREAASTVHPFGGYDPFAAFFRDLPNMNFGGFPGRSSNGEPAQASTGARL